MDKRYNEGATWFALFVTVISLIPTFASLVKGVVKLIWKGSKLGDLLKLFNYFMKGNGMKWLKKFKASELAKYTDDAKKIAHDVFNVIADKLHQLKQLVPESLANVKNGIQDTLNTLQKVKNQINGQFDNIASDLGGKLGKVLEESLQKISGSAKSTIKMQQSANDASKNMDVDGIISGPNKKSDEAVEKARSGGEIPLSRPGSLEHRARRGVVKRPLGQAV